MTDAQRSSLAGLRGFIAQRPLERRVRRLIEFAEPAQAIYDY